MTNMRRWLVAALLCSAWFLWLTPTAEAGKLFCNRYADGSVAPAGTLSVEPGGTRFTVFNTATSQTEPKFLTMLSFFGAMRSGYDPAPIFVQLCDLGFTGVRIFADFWDSEPGGPRPLPNDLCDRGFLPESQAVIQRNGTLKSDRVERLKYVLTAARNAGLVVDLSFAFEVVQGRSIDAHREGIRQLGYVLNSPLYDHVMFDVQNEFDFNGCPRDNHDEKIPGLIQAGKEANSARIVFASSGEQLANLVVVHNAGGTVLAPHTTQGGSYWYNLASTALANNVRKPLYAQENKRWTPSNNVTSLELFLLGREARVNGAAGWTFHTEALFWPNTALRPWGTPELEFLGIIPGHRSIYDVAIDDCNHITAPPGWMLPWC